MTASATPENYTTLTDATPPPRRFANTKAGHKALIKWLTETPLYRVVFEPTVGPIIAPSNARWASLAFRSSRSIRVRRAASLRRPARLAKTDRAGCRLDPGSHGRLLLELEARPARSELCSNWKELYVARKALGEGSNRRQRTAEKL